MRPLLALFVAFCLVSVAIPNPIPEGNEGAAEGTEEPKNDETDQTTEQPAENTSSDGGEPEPEEGEEKKPEDQDKSKDQGEGGDGKGEAKNNPAETYNKVIEMLDKTTKIDKVDSSYLRAGLVSDLQTYLRNPIIDVIGRVGDYSKIASCFKSMGEDVKKILAEILKSFQSCKEKKDSNEHHCSEDRSSSQGQIASISSTISSCVASKRS